MLCVSYPVYPSCDICKTIIKFQNQDADSHTVKVQNISITTVMSHVVIL